MLSRLQAVPYPCKRPELCWWLLGCVHDVQQRNVLHVENLHTILVRGWLVPACALLISLPGASLFLPHTCSHTRKQFLIHNLTSCMILANPKDKCCSHCRSCYAIDEVQRTSHVGNLWAPLKDILTFTRLQDRCCRADCTVCPSNQPGSCRKSDCVYEIVLLVSKQVFGGGRETVSSKNDRTRAGTGQSM